MNQNELEFLSDTAYFQNLIYQTSERLKFISDRKEAKAKALPSVEQLKDIITEQERNQPTDTLMMNLLIKSIQAADAPVIESIVVKEEKVNKEQPVDVTRTVDMLAKAHQIVNSNYCQTPDTLLFYLAKRRLDIEAGVYRDTEFVKTENSCIRHRKRYKKR